MVKYSGEKQCHRDISSIDISDAAFSHKKDAIKEILKIYCCLCCFVKKNKQLKNEWRVQVIEGQVLF